MIIEARILMVQKGEKDTHERTHLLLEILEEKKLVPQLIYIKTFPPADGSYRVGQLVSLVVIFDLVSRGGKLVNEVDFALIR